MHQNRLPYQLIDVVCILAALAISSEYILPSNLEIFADYTGASTFTVLIFFLSFYMMDCYSVGREDLRDSVLRVVIAVLVGVVGAGFAFYSFENWRFPRFLFVFQMILALVFCLSWRLAYYYLSKKFIAAPERVIFLGAGMAGRARRVLTEYMPEASILGYVGEEGANPEEAGAWLGFSEDALAVVTTYKATKVLVLDACYLTPKLSADLFDAKLKGLRIEDMRSLYERLAKRVPIDLIEDQWLLLADGFDLNVGGSMQRLKRAFDVVIAFLLLILASPLLLVTAICVRWDSPGSIIYTQRRVGLYGREFTVYKIRSMRHDAEKDGAVWAQKNDPRVTQIGKFIRKTRIDELPQLINVLKGDMSIVGPRPERMDFVQELEVALPYYQVRHTVKPGITGWAQVCYPYGASLEDSRYKLEYDLYYIKHMSILLEMKIMLKTIGVVLFPKGAR